MAAQFILQFIFIHWESVTNGDVGLTVKPAEVFGIALNTEDRFYYLILFMAACSTLFAVNVINSMVGRAFIASDVPIETVQSFLEESLRQ